MKITSTLLKTEEQPTKKAFDEYVDTDNIQTHSQFIYEYNRMKINSVYGIGGTHCNKIDKTKLKATMFKMEVIKLMLQYDLCISHEDEHGGFRIIPYKQNYAEWFNDAEYKEEQQ